jgi:hypothetical protein
VSKSNLVINLKCVSKFHINKAVAEKLGQNRYTKTFPDGTSEELTFEIIKNTTDYCNSWADAGPIIEKYRIALIHPNDMTDEWTAAKFGDMCDSALFQNEHKSPLVAAMLVFLDMEVV